MSKAEFNPAAGIPPEASEQRSVDSTRKQISLQIINSILTDGLQSRSNLVAQGQTPFTSGDGTDGVLFAGQAELSGRLVIPFGRQYPVEYGDAKTKQLYGDIKQFQKIELDENLFISELVPRKYIDNLADYLLMDGLYGAEEEGNSPGYALFPVLAERDGETDGWERRMRVSSHKNFLVVAPLKELDKTKMKNNGQCKGRMSLSDSIPHHKFSVILLPEYIDTELRAAIQRTDVPVRTVGDTEKQIANRGEFVVPDYESAIRDMLEETGEPLFLHGVRLPTNEDVEMGRA